MSSGRLHILHRGVYAVGRGVVGLRGRWFAAVLTSGEGALLSHTDGAAAWDLLPVSGSRTHVTVPGRGRRAQKGIVLHRVRTLHPDDCAIREGIPVTSIPRTLLDLAEVVDTKRLERAYEEAERRRRLDRRTLAELLERSRGRKGLKPLIALLEAHDGHIPDTRSDLEKAFVTFCRTRTIPLPAFNVVVEGHTVDAFWPSAKLVVELDSWKHHHTREDFENDRARDITLHTAGHQVLRVTDRRLKVEADSFERAVRVMLRERSGSLP